MDSNHRRLRQLSYSQPHLATLVTALVLKNSLLFCGYKYRTFSIRCKILNTKIQWIICENSTYSPISLTTKLIFTYGVYIHVYPNCTLISVNMYITALLIIFFTFWQPLCHFQDLLLKPDKWLNNSIMKKSSIIGVLILCFAFWGKAQFVYPIRKDTGHWNVISIYIQYFPMVWSGRRYVSTKLTGRGWMRSPWPNIWSTVPTARILLLHTTDPMKLQRKQPGITR